MREDLIGYVLGALDESERIRLEREIEQNIDLRLEVERLRAQLVPLDDEDFQPPAGLVERTCELVEDYQATGPQPVVRPESQSAVSPARQPAMSPANEFTGRVGWTFADMVVAGGVLIAAALLFFPVIAKSRFGAQVTACQENMQQVGRALQQYADLHAGFFPSVSQDLAYADAGIYAPLLTDNGYILEPHRFICPTSPDVDSLLRWSPPTIQELRQADEQQLVALRVSMGGTYGYQLGYRGAHGYMPPRNLARPNFVILADTPGPRSDLRSSNHGGRGQNVLFEDGHVAFIRDANAVGEDFYRSDRGVVEPGRHRNDAVVARSGISLFRVSDEF